MTFFWLSFDKKNYELNQFNEAHNIQTQGRHKLILFFSLTINNKIYKAEWNKFIALGKGPKRKEKKKKFNLFPKWGGGLTQKFTLIKSIFGQINKKSKIDFEKFTFQGGRGRGQGQFGKSLYFEFPLLLSTRPVGKDISSVQLVTGTI